jgi:MFS family permease
MTAPATDAADETDGASDRPDPAEVRARRFLLASSACVYLGMGLGTTVTTLYLTLVLGFPIAQVAMFLSAAGVAAVALSPAAGRLADRFGPRPVYLALITLQVLGRAALVVVHGRTLLGCGLALTTAGFPATIAVRAALISAIGGQRRYALAATSRAASNLGYAVGAAAAGGVLALGTSSAYRTALAASAVLTFAACILSTGIPRVAHLTGPDMAGVPRPERRRALANPAFILITVTSGCVLMLYDDMLIFALPLWTTHHTRAPAWICAVALTANTFAIAAFQIAVSRRINGVRRAGRATLAAAMLMAAACLGYAATQHLDALAASLVLLGVVLMLTAAEVLQTAGAIVLGYDLAPPDRQGDYQGVYGSGYALIACFSPLLLSIVLAHPPTGWIALGIALAAVGGCVPLLARRAQAAAVLAAAVPAGAPTAPTGAATG